MAIAIHPIIYRTRSRRDYVEPLPRPPRQTSSVMDDINTSLREVRHSLRTTREAIKECRDESSPAHGLLGHWQRMLGIMRESERDLLNLKDEWLKRAGS